MPKTSTKKSHTVLDQHPDKTKFNFDLNKDYQNVGKRKEGTAHDSKHITSSYGVGVNSCQWNGSLVFIDVIADKRIR